MGGGPGQASWEVVLRLLVLRAPPATCDSLYWVSVLRIFPVEIKFDTIILLVTASKNPYQGDSF